MDLQSVRILVAEDDLISARVAEFALKKRGADVTVVNDGRKAIAALSTDKFDAVITDWMMPEADGIHVIKHARSIRPIPAIVMITILDDAQARATALSAGADEFLARPCSPSAIVSCVETALARSTQPAPTRRKPTGTTLRIEGGRPSFAAVGVAASTGGPDALYAFTAAFKPTVPVALFVTQHGPAWMLDAFAIRLSRQAPHLRVSIATEGLVVTPGQLVVAPGDRHLTIDAACRVKLDIGPPENFVRPSADPMLKSLARVFGRNLVGVVLSGLGRDGALGATEVIHAGGSVFAQDPTTASAPSMPETTIDLGIVSGMGAPAALGALVAAHMATQIRITGSHPAVDG